MRPLLVATAALAASAAIAPVPAHATTRAPVVVARYNFDGGRASSVRDQTGNGHTMSLIARSGGTLRGVTHGAGQALQFPAKCSATASCPHAVLQTPSSADLNPGRRPLAFGATVRLARSQTTRGQNVVQKGYAATSSQYKLQIDGTAGRPSCVVVDTVSSRIRLVRSSVTVADGAWHDVSCRRAASAFTIIVDGVVRGSGRVPSTLTISNSRPLSIGGKGAYPDNDQFQGAVDDVWVRIG